MTPSAHPAPAGRAGTQDLGGRWQLAPSVSEAWRFRALHRDREQPAGAFARTAWIEARVPGSVHADLIRAGLIRDPNLGLASLAAEWISARAWVYRRVFRVAHPAARRLHLRFDGVDYSGEVFLNGKSLGTLAGTHTPTRFDVSGLDRAAEHLLVVALREPPAEDGQLGRTSATRTLKPRFGYGWDFAARLVSVGLAQGVYLDADEGSALVDVCPHVTLNADLSRADVLVEAELDGEAPVTAVLTHPDGRQDQLTVAGGPLTFTLDRPQLWWPAGLGGQPLYTLHVSVPGARAVQRRFGVRRVQLVHNGASAARGAAPLTLEVNGQPLYARGFNVVPADLVPGRDGEAARERRLVGLARAAHANLLRFNGVAPVASGVTLDACDEAGLLVWQEMPLSSSGTDNLPPQNEAFLNALDRDLPGLIRHLRAHPSVALLGGGNELTDEARVPVTAGHPTIRRMAQLARRLDGTRPFLPTSPSGPAYDLSVEAALNRPGDLHDVHGPWHYRGTHDSYHVHTLNRALAHSEFGCQAAARRSTLEQFLTDGPVWPMDDRNPQVVHHGDCWLMRHRIEEVFGPVHHLGTYVLLTQAAQADVLRHALGWNRSRTGECSLALVWQLNEPWPNAHGTSVIDYDLKPKLAYYRCREANAPRALHLALPGPVGEGALTLRPQVLADAPGTGQLTLTLRTVSGMTLHDHRQAVSWPAPGEALVWSWPAAPALLRAELRGERGQVLARTETWVTRAGPQPFRPLLDLPPTTLQAEQRGEHLHVRNAGALTAPWVTLEAAPGVTEAFGDSGFSLLPGEARDVPVQLTGPDGAQHGDLSVQALNAAPVTLAWREV